MKNQNRVTLKEVRFPIINVAQAIALDRSHKGTSLKKGYALMEEAGEALFEKIQSFRFNHQSEAHKPVLIFTGGGNNGGDGFVAARLLRNNKIPYSVYGLVDPKDFKNEALLAYRDFIKAGGEFSLIIDVTKFVIEPSSGCLVVDALLGVGATGILRPRFAKLVETLNNLNLPILAVDSPTIPLRANETLLFGFPRCEAFELETASYYGSISVAPLSYKKSLTQKISSSDYWIPESNYRQLFPCRNEFLDKRAQGTGLLIAGSLGMTGAPSLAALAALRSGIGLLSMAVPLCLLDILSSKLTEPVLYPIGDSSARGFSENQVDELKSYFKHQNAICIGPGISQRVEVKKMVIDLLPSFTSPVILDADALNALEGKPEKLLSLKVPAIITPHAREWGRLFGPLPTKIEDVISVVKEKASQYKVTIVLKGVPTCIASSKGEVYLVGKANSGLAKGGSGDVLAGIILALLAQGLSTLEAALLGTWIHAEAGEHARTRLGSFSMLPSDVIDSLSSVFMNKKDL